MRYVRCGCGVGDGVHLTPLLRTEQDGGGSFCLLRKMTKRPIEFMYTFRGLKLTSFDRWRCWGWEWGGKFGG